MKIGGYTRNILYVDLSTGDIRKEEVSLELIKKFIGGYGISIRLAFDLIKPGINPLSPDNPIIFGAGPLIGTPVLGCGKIQAIYKYALNGAIAHGSGGSEFGIQLKRAGYDHLVITGASEKPVYLYISDDKVEICDADDLWGKDTYETTDILYDRHNDCSVITYGMAGERLVKTSICFVDKCTPFGKGGLAAIMGSKRLKAIVAKGTKGIYVVDPESLKKIMLPIIESCKKDPQRMKSIELGTMAGFDAWVSVCGSTRKNYRETIPVEEARRLYGPDVYLKKLRIKRIACPNCLVACKEHIQIKEGEFSGLETCVSSIYGRMQNLGVRCNVGSINRVVKLLDFCNRTSVCLHHTSALIEWAVDLYKRGILTKEDTGGLELDWNYETTAILLEQIAKNEGLGAILGQGFYGAIKSIGRGCEKYAVHIKGIEPLFDARACRLGVAEFYEVVGPRGGHIGLGGLVVPYLTRDLPVSIFYEWAKSSGVPEDAIRRIFNPPTQWNVGRLTVWADIRAAVESALGIGCTRKRLAKYYESAPGGCMHTYVEIYKAVTGLEATVDDFLRAGDRICDLLRLLNLREGFDRRSDRFPDIWFEPLLRHGKPTWLEDYFGNRLSREDCEKLLDDYYDERGWDIRRGVPTKEKLIKNGLEDIAKKMEQEGYL